MLICLLPEHFALMAWTFGGLCWVTAASRVAAAVEAFGKPDPDLAGLGQTG